jgi:hypothetical protein
MPAQDTWVAPVDKLPDVFMGDRDHMYLLPNGDLFILSPDRTRWIKVNGSGNSVAYDDAEVKRRLTQLEGKTDNFVSGIGVSRTDNKVKLTYTFIDGTRREVEFEDKDTKSIAYDDTALKSRVKALEDKPDKDTVYDDSSLKARVKALEDKPAPTIKKEPVHRFHNGDIPGTADTTNTRTIHISSILNSDGIKVGDTVEDFYADKNTVNRGIWVVTAVNSDAGNVTVRGMGNRNINLRKNITYNQNTRQLSIEGGDTITLPNDKQTITKQGNRLILSNGGGEVELPTPKDSVPYDDTSLRNRITALEGRTDNDRQALTLEGNKLKLTNGGEVNLSKFDTPVLRIATDDIREPALFEAKTTIPLNSIANKEGIKPGDIVQDIISYRAGGAEFNYWKVTAVEGNNVKLMYVYQDITSGYNDGELRGKIQALENRPIPTKQRLSLSGNTLSLTDGGSVTLPQGTAYNDADVKRRLTALEGKADNDKQTLAFDNNTRRLSISNGNNVTIPSDKQTISKNGNKIVLSNGGGEVDIPTATPYNDADIKRRLGVLEAKPDNDKQTLSISNNRLTISNGNSVDLPQPNLSGYVPIAEYNKLKGALETLLGNLKTSGAWQQTGATIFEGKFYNGRNIATGNINVFGGTADGYHFIKTSNNLNENDLAGGV